MAEHTPGPWRWEINERFKTIQLVGGRPHFDLTIIQPTRWGLNSATLLIRDTAHDGLNILYKPHKRRDWIAPFEGREHHVDWCANVVHPDMQLITAAPELLEFAKSFVDLFKESDMRPEDECHGLFMMALSAIRKAEGES